MKNKLENLLGFEDFKSSWKEKQATKTKRTETGLDILKEGVEEIIPEGLPQEPKVEIDKVEKIKSFIENADVDAVEAIVNQLRDTLLEMEQQGLIDEDTTDNLDDEYGDDWSVWITAVIELPDFPEEGLNNIIEIVNMAEDEDFSFSSLNTDEDVECPDCDGTGQDEEGEECERCDGSGRVYRPDDIPPDDFNEEEDEEGENAEEEYLDDLEELED